MSFFSLFKTSKRLFCSQSKLLTTPLSSCSSASSCTLSHEITSEDIEKWHKISKINEKRKENSDLDENYFNQIPITQFINKFTFIEATIQYDENICLFTNADGNKYEYPLKNIDVKWKYGLNPCIDYQEENYPSKETKKVTFS